MLTLNMCAADKAQTKNWKKIKK